MNHRTIVRLFALILMLGIGPMLYAQRIPMPYAKIQFFDRNGKPLAGGKLYSYVAGTSTPKTTYSSASGAANTNPVILDSSGRANVWLDSTTSYKLILKDSTDVQIWSVDSVTDWGGLLSSGTSEIDGDASGSYDAITVTAIQGVSVSDASPSTGEVLVYDGSQWEPGAVDLEDTDAITGALSVANGGTGSEYTGFTGPSEAREYTLPDADDTIATYDNANTFTAAQAVTPITLTIAVGDGTIATDADEGNIFRVTLTTSCPCTLSTPTNPTNGQIATWEVIQATAGNETLAYSAVFTFGTDVTEPTITVTASKRDFITAIYNSTTAKWYVLQVSQGY